MPEWSGSNEPRGAVASCAAGFYALETHATPASGIQEITFGIAQTHCFPIARDSNATGLGHKPVLLDRSLTAVKFRSLKIPYRTNRKSHGRIDIKSDRFAMLPAFNVLVSGRYNQCPCP